MRRDLGNHQKCFFEANSDAYIKAYAYNLCIRDSCFFCNYKGLNRITDITLGDAWGIKHGGTLDDNKGTSLIMVHTINGNNIIKELSQMNRIVIQQIEQMDDFIIANPCIVRPIAKNLKQLKFENSIQKGLSFEFASNKYAKKNLLQKVRLKIKSFIA